MPTTLNAATSERNTAGTRFSKLRQHIMGFDSNTIGTVLSLLPAILEQANRTIDKFENRKKTGTESSRAEGVVPDPNTWIVELEVAILQQVEPVRLPAKQCAITVDASCDEVVRLERRLRCMTWLASIGFVAAIAALSFVLQAL